MYLLAMNILNIAACIFHILFYCMHSIIFIPFSFLTIMFAIEQAPFSFIKNFPSFISTLKDRQTNMAAY